jgi:catalase
VPARSEAKGLQKMNNFKLLLRHLLTLTLMVVVTVLVVSGIYVVFAAYKSPPRVGNGINIPNDEALRFAQIVNNGEHIVNNTRREVGDGVYRRDAHAKTHGCVAASFTVKDLHDVRFQQGVFHEPNKSYKAWIRFSSGDFGINNDWAPDARGMAIKLLGVEGKKLLEGEQNATTQDFLMINNPVFFIRTVEEYVALTTYQGQNMKYAYFFPGWKPANWQIREFRLGLGILKPPPPRNLLATRFYSMSAYRLGSGQFIKFSAKPVACKADGDVPSSWAGFGANILSESLARQVKSGEYCFDFMVQLQAPQKYMPVEDTTIEWKEKDSPFVPVARVTIRPQEVVGPKDAFCENLSFSPWHALPEHEPVGGMNRARKVVYQQVARYRRCSNGQFFGEPADDGSKRFTTEACDASKPAPEVRSSLTELKSATQR